MMSTPTTAQALALGFLLAMGRAASAPADQEEATPVVQLSQGEITGVFKTSAAGNKYMAFLGIPYAKPPVGDLRFKGPEPPGEWEGVFQAKTEGNICPQPHKPMMEIPTDAKTKMKDVIKTLTALPNFSRFAAKHMMHMKEDCLFLNVYSPVAKLPASKLLPVLVFIHGGAFFLGSADSMIYGADYLMDKPVILVTLNYRLGPLGYLATNTADVPGNAGIKDQRLALRWVRDNIHTMGGDAKKVTIYGESAGSYSVHMHVLSPGSKGLFHAAIMSSSMSPNAYGFQADPDTMSTELAVACGADAETAKDPAKRVQFLRGVPVTSMFDKMQRTMLEMTSQLNISAMPWAVVAEPSDTDDPVITRPPNEILREGLFDAVPIIIGLNNVEAKAITYNEQVIEKIGDDPTRFVPRNMYNKMDEKERQELGKEVFDFYLKGKTAGKEALSGKADILGDTYLGHGIHLASKWHVKYATAKAPVYLYLFTLDAYGIFSLMLGINKTDVTGAGHADDLGYVFKQHLLDGLDMPEAKTDRAIKGRGRMVEIITNFVKDRNPTPAKTADVDVEWTSALPDKEQYLEIGDELTMKEGLPQQKRMDFWDEKCRKVLKDPLCES